MGAVQQGEATGTASIDALSLGWMLRSGSALSISATAERFGFKSGYATAGNLVGGQLQNGANAAVTFSQIGTQLRIGVCFVKGPAGTLSEIEAGATNAAAAAGADSLETTALMVKDSMARLLNSQGFTQEIKDGKTTGNWIKSIKIKKDTDW